MVFGVYNLGATVGSNLQFMCALVHNCFYSLMGDSVPAFSARVKLGLNLLKACDLVSCRVKPFRILTQSRLSVSKDPLVLTSSSSCSVAHKALTNEW